MTPNQRIFADEYIRTRNATRAYMVAYPKTKNENTAHTAAGRLLRNVAISAYIDAELDKLHNAAIADAAEIMAYLSSVMRGEVKDEMMSVQGDVSEVRVRATDRNAAAKQLARMLGIESRVDAERLRLEQDKAQREAQAEQDKKALGVLDSILQAVSDIE